MSAKHSSPSLPNFRRKFVRKFPFMQTEKTSKETSLLVGSVRSTESFFIYGTLVNDREEHDFVTDDGRRVSVKTRKGWNSGWKQTSAIPKIEGIDCPTHLLFVHLNDDYSIDRMWLIEWCLLVKAERFKKHMVRGSQRSFIFAIDEEKDKAHVVYSKNR